MYSGIARLGARTSICAAIGVSVVCCSAVSHGRRSVYLSDAPPAIQRAENPRTTGGEFSLTVYSTADPATFTPQDLLQQQLNGNGSVNPWVLYAPGYGVVREVRRIELATGINRLRFTDVAAGIDPTTVAFRSLTAPDATSVLEQNFEFDLNSPDKLLQKYLDKQVVLAVRAPASNAPPQLVRGKLLSSGASGYYGAYIIQTDDSSTPLAIIYAQDVESVRLAANETGLVSKPTLDWRIETQKTGAHDVQVTYQTDGLTWRADYNLLVDRDEKAAGLSAWVTLLNASGLTYPDAHLKLVAGNVQRFEPPGRGGAGGATVTNQLFAAGGNMDTGFKEKGFFEYHLYTLCRTTTVPNNSTKQIELFSPKEHIPIEKVYVYYGLPPDPNWRVLPQPQLDRNYSPQSNKDVDIYLRFRNDQKSGLGIPLPAGRVRVYKTDPADDSREFIGEDVIRHTPRDEDVMARLGTAFDLVGERVQSDYTEEDERHVVTESFEITLRNHKNEPVSVIVRENLYRWFNWEIIRSSDKWKKIDSRTIHIPVEVAAHGEKKVTYTVKYQW